MESTDEGLIVVLRFGKLPSTSPIANSNLALVGKEELERNSNIYSKDIVTTIADELQEYNSRRSNEINECCESIHHRMQLLNYDQNREIQSLNEDYNRKINLLKHKSDSELLKRLYSDGKFNDKPEYNAPDYDWEYTKYKNSLKDSEVRFDRELEKYENELKN
ncbi:phosphocholine transferase AnkX [Trichonephila clavata]|uniref:Phosphocholine transferase AnkX n=1 Tax=Trichonephila clavata TaxID=2740835 RepID=A0A8X6I445_TRICU|nr:phosphocholine transferase AnkX [Trichonephila clavata]